ncbi:FAD-dependent oxidoreductase [Oerskovia jenensis]|uniref:D-amino-acid dehydrogenase n=1 Tax=Oerskovia jenensis TaxID=162169 RepID=A0ABS2LG82_9CELL|nr:FAD-dependent oxidoreductase [Oerskovia jenensis]MBM7479431.1 D-amino-acid dehydrogenase [Oerskovia jenensis]
MTTPSRTTPGSPAPRTAVVVGAGMVGLATAWHLQRLGVEVTVLDREGVAAGSSWGNAGWLTPGMAMPLADPTLWTYAPKALLDPAAPLHVPARLDPRLWSFLARFATHATQRAWDRAMAALTPIDRLALDAFDELAAHGVAARSTPGPFVIGFEDERQAAPFLHEIAQVEAAGQVVPLRRVDRPDGAARPSGTPHPGGGRAPGVRDAVGHASPSTDPRDRAPETDPVGRPAQLTDHVRAVYTLEGQRFIEPGPFVGALGDAVRARGGRIVTGATVTGLRAQEGRGVQVLVDGQDPVVADVAVLATGAWLPGLAKPLGVRTLVQAGRGYSFTVKTDVPVEQPIYLPSRRVACTPYQGRFRIAGTMEFRGPDEPFQPRRIDAILASVRDLFQGVDLDDRHDEWVGSRPVTPDGLPLVGATRAPGVYVAGGHGMWGIVLGPATGRLLAEQIMTGTVPPEIRSFDPLR